MTIDRESIEENLRLHVDRLAGLIGPRTLSKPKPIQATIGYIEGQWSDMGYSHSRECYDAMGDEATNLIVSARPGVELNRTQRSLLEKVDCKLQNEHCKR